MNLCMGAMNLKTDIWWEAVNVNWNRSCCRDQRIRQCYHWEDRHWFPFQFGQTTEIIQFLMTFFCCSILRLKRKERKINMVSLMPRTKYFTLSSGMHSNQTLKSTGGPGRILVAAVFLLGRFSSEIITLHQNWVQSRLVGGNVLFTIFWCNFFISF